MNKPKLGLYAGSFNPFHAGHMNIVNQAKEIFDKVLVAKGINPEKNILDYPLPVEFLSSLGVSTSTYSCLLTDYIRDKELKYDVTLVRGLRNGADLEYEQNLVAFLKDIYPQIKVVAFYCDPRLRHISSSALRGIEKFSKEEFNKYVISS